MEDQAVRMNETEMSQGPVPQQISPVKPRNATLQIVLASFLALGFFAYLGYVNYVKAYVELAKAVAQTAQYESAAIKYVSNDQKTEVLANLAGIEKLQEFNFATKAMAGVEGSDLRIAGRFDETNGYVQANYSRPEEITKLLKNIYPLIEKTKTYAMVSPVWMGESWLHFEIPKSEEQTPVEWNWDEQKMQDFAWDWMKAVKPGKIVNNFEYEGQKYKKITFGFRKAQLIEAINGFKDLDVEVKVSQINSLVKLVESSDDWDRELFTVLIDQKGDVRVVMMQIPKIEEKYLDETIAESATEAESNPVTNGLITGAKDLLFKQEGEMVKLGVVTFDKFDEVQAVERPTNTVEATNVLMMAQTELGPIIAQLLGGSGAGQKAPAPVKPTTIKTPAPVSCTQYKIREGEFASDKCYTKSDYNDLMYYLQRYNSAIFEYNGAANQANVTCQGFTDEFKKLCEEAKAEMQKAEADKANYANTIRGIIAKGR